jgi:hypothetical protein
MAPGADRCCHPSAIARSAANRMGATAPGRPARAPPRPASAAQDQPKTTSREDRGSSGRARARAGGAVARGVVLALVNYGFGHMTTRSGSGGRVDSRGVQSRRGLDRIRASGRHYSLRTTGYRMVWVCVCCRCVQYGG